MTKFIVTLIVGVFFGAFALELLIKSGKLNLHIHGKFPLSDAAEAHRQLEGRLTTGKLLLIP